MLPSPPSPLRSPDRCGAEKSTAIQWACAVLHNPTDPAFSAAPSERSGRPAFSKMPGKCGNNPPPSSRSQRGRRSEGSSTGRGAAGSCVSSRIVRNRKMISATPAPAPAMAASHQTDGRDQPHRSAKPYAPAVSNRQSKATSSQPRTFHGLMKTSPALCYGCSHRGVRGHATRGQASALPDDSAIPRTRREWVVSLSRQPPVLFV